MANVTAGLMCPPEKVFGEKNRLGQTNRWFMLHIFGSRFEERERLNLKFSPGKQILGFFHQDMVEFHQDTKLSQATVTSRVKHRILNITELRAF